MSSGTVETCEGLAEDEDGDPHYLRVMVVLSFPGFMNFLLLDLWVNRLISRTAALLLLILRPGLKTMKWRMLLPHNLV